MPGAKPTDHFSSLGTVGHRMHGDEMVDLMFVSFLLCWPPPDGTSLQKPAAFDRKQSLRAEESLEFVNCTDGSKAAMVTAGRGSSMRGKKQGEEGHHLYGRSMT